MKARDITDFLCEYGADCDYSKTCDTYKAGSPEAEVTNVAVTMHATVDIVREVKKWGAQLLIVHEPTYYSHMDVHTSDKIENEKRKLIEKSGLTVFRFHDHSHYAYPDIICKGVAEKLALSGEITYVEGAFDLARIKLDNVTSPVELAREIEKKLGIKHIRICGNRDLPCSRVSLMCGTPHSVFNELKSDECEVMLTGEACEWMLGEWARDASALGYKKTLLILGHIGSERAGMEYTANIIKEKFPSLEVKYFESGEVCSYTD